VVGDTVRYISEIFSAGKWIWTLERIGSEVVCGKFTLSKLPDAEARENYPLLIGKKI
jgi:hypothetical protein